MFGIRNKVIYYQDYNSEMEKYNNLVNQAILKNKFLSLKIYEFETKESMYYEGKVIKDEKLTSYWEDCTIIDYEFNSRKSKYFICENGYFTYADDVDINGNFDTSLKYFSYAYTENKTKEELTVENVDIDLMIGSYLAKDGFGSSFIDFDSELLVNFNYYVKLPISSDLFIAYFIGNTRYNNTYGIVSSTGRIILPFRYSNITLLNSNKREIEDDSPLYLRSDCEIFNEVSFTFLLKDSEFGTWQIINSDLQVLVEDLYDLKFINSSNRIVAKKYIDSKEYVCLLDKNGFLLNIIEGVEFKILNEYIVIEDNDEYIFVNSLSGSIILSTSYYKLELSSEQTYFEDVHILNKYFILKIDSNFGLYDWNFREILPPDYQEITRTNTHSKKMEFKIVKNNRIEIFFA